MLPNLVIIGAQKSASTFVHACLSEHPDVYIPSSETPFFESPDYEQYSIASLERLFDGKEKKILGIKRPSYLGKQEVPGRLEEHLPDAKLIVVLRNPVERAVSAYFHNINLGFLPVLGIEEGFKKLMDDKFRIKYKRSSEVIEFGMYYKYLIQYKYAFERGNILVLLYEDIRDYKIETYQKICHFLGINDGYVPEAINSRYQEVIYNLTRLKFVRLRNRFLYDYDVSGIRLHQKQNDNISKIIGHSISLIDKIFLAGIFSNKKPRLSNDLRHYIFNIYRDDIRSLQTLIGRNLDNWVPN